MMKTNWIRAAAVAPLLLSFCACTATRFAHQLKQTYSAPAVVDLERSANFPAGSFDRVWESVIAFFSTRQISIETVEKESGIIVAKQMLTASSDGGGIALLGTVSTERAILKQTMTPSQFGGSANPSIVMATGTVSKQELVQRSLTTSTKPAMYQVAVSFNVFVSRFSEAELKVTINSTINPAERLQIWNGWYWAPSLSSDTPGSEDEIARSLMVHHVQPTLVEAKPVSAGTLEKALIEHLRSQVK